VERSLSCEALPLVFVMMAQPSSLSSIDPSAIDALHGAPGPPQ
jgi:hypothetical protein